MDERTMTGATIGASGAHRLSPPPGPEPGRFPWAEANERDFDFGQMLAVLWKGKVWIVLGMILGLAGGAFQYANTPLTYQAEPSAPIPPSATRPRRSLPPNSPQWAISFAHLNRCADRPLLRRRNRAKFNRGLWCQPDERRGSQHPVISLPAAAS